MGKRGLAVLEAALTSENCCQSAVFSTHKVSVGGFGFASPGKQDSDSAGKNIQLRAKYFTFVWYKALSQYKHPLSVQAP